MSIPGSLSPYSSYASGYTGGLQGSSPLQGMSSPTSSLLGQQSPMDSLGGMGDMTGGLGGMMGGSPLGGNSSMTGMIMQLLQMMMMLMQTLMGGLGGGMGGQSDPSSMLGGAGSAGSAAPATQTLSANPPPAGNAGSSSSNPPVYQQSGAPPGQLPTPEKGYSMSYSPSPSGGNSPTSSPGAIGNGGGWSNNVGVFASSDADHETVDSYDPNSGNLVGGYLSSVEDGMDKGESLTQAHDNAQAPNGQSPIRNNANPNSLVKGKGGNAVVVTGDGINPQEANQLADHLKKDYGMNVKVIPNSSPNQLRAALQEMGQQKGQQCMVAVLAHGAHDDSGKKDGDMALGKGDGDQWLHENDLKSMVNQYLAPNYGNVNVLLNSCFSGNFVQ